MHSKLQPIPFLFLLPFVAAVLTGCPTSGEDEPADTEAATGGSTAADLACSPGETLACACTDGSMGTQACATDGESYDACSCDPSATTTSPSSSGTTASTTTSTSTSTTGALTTTGAAESSTGSRSESGGGSESSGERACVPGEVSECACGDGSGVARCNDGGQFGECICCAPTHPLVEGDLRFCEEGHCYCGDLTARPPLDSCFAEQIAEFCCPVEVVCY